MSVGAQFHHRSTTKSSHKPFKSRHATKSALRDAAKGKVEPDRGKRNKKPLHMQALSKIERRNKARQLQQTKHREHLKATSIFSGNNAAARLVAVVPLTTDADPNYAIEQLLKSVSVDEPVKQDVYGVSYLERFRQHIKFLPVKRDLFHALDACRVADFVVFILSAVEEVDEQGELLLRTIESQGVSNVVTVVCGLNSIEPAKRRPQVLGSLKSFISHFFPEQDKLPSLDIESECLNTTRSLCTTTPKGIKWREDRSWMHVDRIEWEEGKDEPILSGTIRGQPMNADRLLQVGDFGALPVSTIVEDATISRPKKKGPDTTMTDATPQVLQTPGSEHDETDELAPEEISMDDGVDMALSVAPSERKGVLLDDHHYFSDDETHLPPKPTRLPKGTSAYQAAWYLEDVSDSESDVDTVADATESMSLVEPPRPEDGIEGLARRPPTEIGGTEYPQSEMFLDPSPDDEAAQLAEYRQSRKADVEDDLEFPDEIELHPNVLARERLARYRGLKSMRTSTWDPSEDVAHQPEEWNRLLEISDYRGQKGRCLREALVGGVPAGTRVNIHLHSVPADLRTAMLAQQSSGSLAAYGLLRHEQKRAAMNYSITLSSDHDTALKSKDELIMQCGPRRFIVNPIFSQAGSTPNDVHKFDRFLHPGMSAMATAIAPLTWGSVPVLYFKREHSESGATSFEFIGTGTSLPPSKTRVIAKRVILTGHPYKIHKNVVTIRYMFFNNEDVAWFKALQLWTKRGRSGFIKESLGTHGYFKANFDGKIDPQDAVGVSLYKRVFPRWARPFQSWTLGAGVGAVEH